MNRAIARCGVVLLLCHGVFAQAPAARPEFDVADIKPNKSGETDVNGGVLPGGQFGMRNVPLKMLLAFAYSPNIPDRFTDGFVTGAPGWTASDRFDITGKAPPATPDKTLSLMLQVFLEKEFKIKTHQEQKTMNIFALVVGKGGPELQTAAGTGNANCPYVGPQGPNYGGAHRVCSNMRMGDFAEALPDIAPGYIDRPVVDMTGLTGAYDFKLEWVGRNNIDNGGITMFDAIGKLGLKLEEKRLAMPIVVIDHIEKLADDR